MALPPLQFPKARCQQSLADFLSTGMRMHWKEAIGSYASRFRNALASSLASANLPSLKKPLRIALVCTLILLAVIILYFVVEKLFIYYFARRFVRDFSEAAGLNRHLADALVWVVFAAVIVFAASLLSFSRSKRLIGAAGVLVLLVSQPVVLWWITKDHSFDRAGNATKCYIVSRDAITCGDRPGIDPVTGRECRPVTPEVAERIDAYQHGKRPAKVVVDEPTFFDLRTGYPIIWFKKMAQNRIEIFDLMGFHPETGDELQPVTREVVELWKQQKARHAPNEVDPHTYPLFDPITGEARAWYRQSDGGDYQFFDRPGFHSQTGEALKPITADVLNAWRAEESKRRHITKVKEPSDSGIQLGDQQCQSTAKVIGTTSPVAPNQEETKLVPDRAVQSGRYRPEPLRHDYRRAWADQQAQFEQRRIATEFLRMVLQRVGR